VRRLACVLVVAACSSSSPPPEPKAGCNPLVGDDCMSPYPSSFYEAADPTTETGVTMAIPDGILPAPTGGTSLSPARLNLHDGMSRTSPFVVYFEAGVDPSQLPTLDQLDTTVTAAAPVQVLEFATGARVPVFAEVDANASVNQRQGLIIRPQVPLKPATRYVVALVDLKDASGHVLAPAPFAALRDRTDLSKALTALAPGYEDIFAALAKAGVDRSSLSLAWDVTTSSDDDATAHLVAMRDQALQMVDSLTWTITSNQTFDGSGSDGSDANRLREVAGTFQVPSFLVDDSLTGVLNIDAKGNPILRGLGSANFVVDIPQCAGSATGPLPVAVFGHGLFGDAQSELETDYEKQVGNFMCVVQIGTDWIGLAQQDLPTISNQVVLNFDDAHLITDRLQQAHVNAQVLTRLFLTRMKDDPALQVNGHPVTDGSQVYYYGISNGGIQGTTFMALSEDVQRGVLNVPGCEWSTLIQRSTDFGALQLILQSVLPDPLDEQVLITLLQFEFDTSDGCNFAQHVLGDPLPGAAPGKQVLLQEGIGDAQVTNVATRVLARQFGVPGLDLEQPVFGVMPMTAPLASAYTQWDISPDPVPPAGNQALGSDNGVHEDTRRLQKVEDQMKAFLTPTGMVVDECGGSACICNEAGGTCVNAPDSSD
jgi:hypothetical protein